jgi:hypothetical protein
MRSACQCSQSASHQFSASTLKRLHNCGSKLWPTHCACMIPLSIQGGQDCSRHDIKNLTLNFANRGGNNRLHIPRQAPSWEQNKIIPGWASIENGQCAYFVSAIFAFLSQAQPRRMTPVTTRQGCQLGLFSLGRGDADQSMLQISSRMRPRLIVMGRPCVVTVSKQAAWLFRR